jgi:DNA-binding transcriptional regulator YiaG
MWNGRTIKLTRERLGMSRVFFALFLGCALEELTAWESGETPPLKWQQVLDEKLGNNDADGTCLRDYLV